MNPEVKKALNSLNNELKNYPEMIMVTVSRKDLETVVKCLNAQKKPLAAPTKWVAKGNVLNRYI